MRFSTYFSKRKLRKRLHGVFTHARTLYRMRVDVEPPEKAADLKAALRSARLCLKGGGTEELTRQIDDLTALVQEWHPLHRNGWTENYEVLVVALGVAMAFRCYFFQPFKIPTGSMQPTLYGIHSTERDSPGFFDKPVLKHLKWVVTGDWYREVRVATGGKVVLLYRDDSKPGYMALQVGSRRYYVPSDAVMERRALNVDQQGNIQPGARLWSGVVHAGDHVFVNRVLWNFRPPERGEVMVFSTRDIPGLPPGTHYIKRMVGMPGETISIDPPQIFADGQSLYHPDTIGRIVRREKMADWAPPYSGYLVIGEQAPVDYEPALKKPGDSVSLGSFEYYALGDNTGNSRDSRYWGPVPERNLLGPAALVYWPFTSPRWGRIR